LSVGLFVNAGRLLWGMKWKPLLRRSLTHSPPLPPSPPSLTKEAASYEKEAVAQEQKIAGMRERGQDVYDIKKQEEVLQESYMMIPDSKARLQAALEDLEAFLVRKGGREGLNSQERCYKSLI